MATTLTHSGSDRKVLSLETTQQILKRMPEFTELKPWRSFFAMLMDWVIIFSTIVISVKLSSLPVYLLAIIVIASRQHALLVLMHEATHLRLARRRWLNDALGEATSFPHFVALETFRDNHLQHHRYNCTEKDPDWVRLLPLKDWHFPQNGRSLTGLFVRYIYGYGIVEILQLLWDVGTREKSAAAKAELENAGFLQKYWRAGLYLAIFLGLGFSHQLLNFVLYWLVPLFFTLPPILRLRGIAEHYGLPMTHDLNDTRNVLCSGFEAFLLAPHSVNYHLDHHLFPAVPFYNLPKLHQFLMQFEDYRENAYTNRSYFLPSSHSLLSDLRTVEVVGPVFGFPLKEGVQ